MTKLKLAIILATIAITIATSPTHAQQTVQVTKACNLRSGPGTRYARVGGVSKGDVLGVWSSQPEWYKVGERKWIAVFCTSGFEAKP